jgi:hypothetical protein
MLALSPCACQVNPFPTFASMAAFSWFCLSPRPQPLTYVPSLLPQALQEQLGEAQAARGELQVELDTARGQYSELQVRYINILMWYTYL